MTRESIESIRAEVEALKCRTQKEIEEARVRLLGKKGEITALFDEFRTIDKEMKKEFGKTLNELKTIAQTKIEEMKSLAGIEDGGESCRLYVSRLWISSASLDMMLPKDPRSKTTTTCSKP